jgi:hypothetical protein
VPKCRPAAQKAFTASWRCLFFMSAEPLATKADIWSRTIQPAVGDMSPEGALELLRLRISDEDAGRVRELSGKASRGQLTLAEERELDNYLSVGRLLEFLQAKARLSLRHHGIHLSAN